MPGPLILSLLSTIAPGLWSIGSGLLQANKANKLKLQDTRPDSFREELGLRRLQAASQLMPGQKGAESQIRQNAANSASTMMQSGTGSSGILAGLARLGQSTNQATQQLATQAAGFQEQSRDKLVGSLHQDAAYRTADQQAYNREKAALKQASAQNLFGGISLLGNVGAYAAAGGFDKPEVKDNNAFKIGQNTFANYGAGGIYDPNQQMPIGLGNWNRLRNGNTGRWF